jgi:hypothetical protein
MNAQAAQHKSRIPEFKDKNVIENGPVPWTKLYKSRLQQCIERPKEEEPRVEEERYN